MQRNRATWEMLIVMALAVMVGITSFALTKRRPPAAFALDIQAVAQVAPELLQFQQSGEFSTPFSEVRAIAVGPDNQIFVAGDEAVRKFDAEGRCLQTIAVGGPPACLAIGGEDHAWPGRVYVGVGNRIARFDPQGAPLEPWRLPASGARLTSIAVAEAVYVADASKRQVLQFDAGGKLLGRWGAAEGEAETFSVPSPFFDVATGADGYIHVVNPGRTRIEAFSPDGYPQALWGAAGSGIENFFGCCNPAHLAVMPDGSFVTSEKGIPRVKVYSAGGKFEAVVAGPEQLGVTLAELGDPRGDRQAGVFDVAADQQGRVLVLDPQRRSVRVFTRVEL